MKSSIVGSNSFFPRLEFPQISLFAPDANSGLPSILVREHALMSRCIVLIRAAIEHVFGNCYRPKIRPSIVESVLIYMIDILSFSDILQQLVHENRSAFPVLYRISSSVKRRAGLLGIPIEERQKSPILDIDNGYLSFG